MYNDDRQQIKQTSLIPVNKNETRIFIGRKNIKVIAKNNWDGKNVQKQNETKT